MYLRFVEQEMNCSISTDDPGVFTNSLTSNYQLCVNEFQLTSKQLMQTNLNAARSSFLPEDEREELVKYLEEEYAKVQIDAFWENDWGPNPMTMSVCDDISVWKKWTFQFVLLNQWSMCI